MDKIQQIKAYRNLTGGRLNEAKRFIEENPGWEPAEIKSPCLIVRRISGLRTKSLCEADALKRIDDMNLVENTYDCPIIYADKAWGRRSMWVVLVGRRYFSVWLEYEDVAM